MKDEELARAEVMRAVGETRDALGRMGKEMRLAYPLMGICALIDRVKIDVTGQEGDDAFVLDEQAATITFRAAGVLSVAQETEALANEVGCDDPAECKRLAQMAVNLFVVHELTHIKQNFPHFGSVQQIKEGLPGYGVPMLDVAADTVAAWTCANVECELNEDIGREEVLRAYVNALILAYLVGAFVFDIQGRPNKTQRALGLIISALLVQAEVDGTLVREAIYENWKEISPIFVMDFSKSDSFNAMVIDGVPGMLVGVSSPLPKGLVKQFWESAGVRPLSSTLELGSKILVGLGIVRPADAGSAAS